MTHEIRYFGRATNERAASGRLSPGYRWECSCGASSGDVPWADRWERTWEAHRHVEKMRNETP